MKVIVSILFVLIISGQSYLYIKAKNEQKEMNKQMLYMGKKITSLQNRLSTIEDEYNFSGWINDIDSRVEDLENKKWVTTVKTSISY